MQSLKMCIRCYNFIFVKWKRKTSHCLGYLYSIKLDNMGRGGGQKKKYAWFGRIIDISVMG